MGQCSRRGCSTDLFMSSCNKILDRWHAHYENSNETENIGMNLVLSFLGQTLPKWAQNEVFQVLWKISAWNWQKEAQDENVFQFYNKSMLRVSMKFYMKFNEIKTKNWVKSFWKKWIFIGKLAQKWAQS